MGRVFLPIIRSCRSGSARGFFLLPKSGWTLHWLSHVIRALAFHRESRSLFSPPLCQVFFHIKFNNTLSPHSCQLLLPFRSYSLIQFLINHNGFRSRYVFTTIADVIADVISCHNFLVSIELAHAKVHRPRDRKCVQQAAHALSTPLEAFAQADNIATPDTRRLGR